MSASQVFKLTDLADLQDDLFPASHEWYNIGLRIGLSCEDLDPIKEQYNADSLRDMLKLRLTKSRPLSREDIISALRKPSVGADVLAAELEEKYTPPLSEPQEKRTGKRSTEKRELEEVEEEEEEAEPIPKRVKKSEGGKPTSESVKKSVPAAEGDDNGPIDCTVLAPIFAFHYDPLALYALGDLNKAWKFPPGTQHILRVYFMNGSAGTHRQVLDWAGEWSKHCDLQFKRTNDPVNNDIRIDFKADSSWSCVGIEAYDKPKNECTMNLGEKPVINRHTVLHEFGHVLGLEHEHQHPDLRFEWNEEQVKQDMKKHGPPWDDDKHIEKQILKKNDVRDSLKKTEYDDESIMHYPINLAWIKGNAYSKEIPRNKKLSKKDKKHVSELYGPPQARGATCILLDHPEPTDMETTDAELNRIMTPNEVEKIAERVVKWRKLLGYMDLTEADQSRIDESKADQSVSVIQLWQRKLGASATFQALVDVACDMKDMRLAEDIKKVAKKIVILF